LDNAGARLVFRFERTEPLAQSWSKFLVLSECDRITRRTLQAATETISQESNADRPGSHRLFARSQNILDRFKMAFWANKCQRLRREP
jgi:hypothetical protein